MVRAADDLKEELHKLQGDGVQVSLTGASGMWSDFNTANREAMMKSELISWPVTLLILLLAFGSLVAAGLPLMLTIIGLMASAGSLYLGTQVLDISIWAMNFALMFALALGIDYALFIVYRFRGALFGSHEPVEHAVAETMDTAGKAVLFSGITVLISLMAVMLVPSPAFRSMALGIMISVVFILAATLTLLPAVLGKLGPKVDNLSLPWVHQGEHRSPAFAAWGERLWRHPYAFGALALIVLVALIVPVFGLKTGMPSIKVVPNGDSSRVGYTQVQQAFGKGAPGTAADRHRPGRRGARRRRRQGRPRRRAGHAGRGRAGRQGARAGRPDHRPLVEGDGRDHRPAALRAADRVARRRIGGGEPRPRGAAVVQDAARHRRRPDPRLPPAARSRSRRRSSPRSACSRACWRPPPPSASPGSSSRTGTAAACWASSRRASSTRGDRCSSSR